MVKNTTGGSKHKKQKNSSIKAERPLILKQDDNEGYGQVMSFLGGSMVMIRKLGSQIEFRCRLRKSLPRIFKKDIILYAMREFETKDVGDVLLVYSSDEVRILKKEKYIDEEIEEEELFGEDNENTLLEEEEEEEEEVDINNL
jgi:translation initiation factor IF-1